MAAVACLLLLVSCSIAGLAAPSVSSLATDWEQVGEEASGKTGLYNVHSMAPSAMRDTAELDEVLVKRTSRSPSHRRLHPRLQGAGIQKRPATLLDATLDQHLSAGENADWSSMSRPAPPQSRAGEPTATNTEPSEPYNRLHRRPHKSLKHDPAGKAEAQRQSYARSMVRLDAGYRVNKRRAGGSTYAATTVGEFQSRKRDNSRRYRSNLTEEKRARMKQNQREMRILDKERKEAEREGRTWQGPPVRKRGRPRRNWQQEQAGTDEGRRDMTVDTRLEGGTQHAVDVTHASRTIVWPRLPSASSGSSSLHASLSGAPHQFFPPGPSSSSLDLDLSLLTPGSSTSGQRQTSRAPRREASPFAAGTREEKRLRLTLAPPGQHDRFRLTLAPPRQD